MKYDVNGYQVEGLDLVEKDGTTVFLARRYGSLYMTKPTINDALELVKERIRSCKDLTVTRWTYDAKTGEFVGKLKKNKRGTIAVRAELSKVTQRKVTEKEAEDAIKTKETT